MTTEWWSGAGLALALASMGVVSGAAKAAKARARRDARRAAVEEKRREMRAPVSYTHLTLPTKA